MQNQLDGRNFTFATITWAREPQEAQLLQQSLTALACLDIPVFVTDGGSGPDFLDFLHSFGHFTVLQAQGRGVWAQAKTSLQAAFVSQAPYICYTEPDKLNFFQQGLPSFLREAAKQSAPGVLLASRSAASFASFPVFQQMTETTINQCCAEVLGCFRDYTYGPFLLSRQLVPYLDLVEEDIGWGWRPYLFGLAHRLGLPVEAREGDFHCPEGQQQDNAKERLYRMRQLSQNLQGLVLSTTVPL